MSAIGNIVGHAAAAAGRTYDYATPGSGTSALTNAGRAVYNPNVVLSNPTGIFTKSPAFTPVQNPTSNAGTAPSDGGGPNNSAVLGASTTYDPSSQYGGYGSAADYQAAQQTLANIDQGLTANNDALNRLGGQQTTGTDNINKSYQDAYNRLIGNKTYAEQDYNTNRTGQLNDYLAAKTQNGTSARSFLDNARRTLGANGAGGGSAARYGVVNDANQMLQGANAATTATNNKNIVSLDTSHGRDENNFQNAFQDLITQRDTNTNDLKSKITQQKIDLQNAIGQLMGQKSIANGGNYQAAQAAANPYLNAIPGLRDQVDALAATPAIKEQAVQLQAPTLQGYNWAQPTAPTAPTQDPNLTNNNVPIISPEDQRRNGILGLFGIDPNQLQYVQ